VISISWRKEEIRSNWELWLLSAWNISSRAVDSNITHTVSEEKFYEELIKEWGCAESRFGCLSVNHVSKFDILQLKSFDSWIVRRQSTSQGMRSISLTMIKMIWLSLYFSRKARNVKMQDYPSSICKLSHSSKSNILPLRDTSSIDLFVHGIYLAKQSDIGKIPLKRKCASRRNRTRPNVCNRRLQIIPEVSQRIAGRLK